MFLEIAKEVHQDFPEIEMDDANVDAICMWLLKNPQNYDVIVATNMFGDIISDLAAQMVGGLGFGCSGNIGRELAVFEPSHGSAPKYAGQYKVNPIATILSARMMLDWLGETEKAAALEQATAEVIREGRIRTYDMGGLSTTLEMGEAIAAKL
jgi:3-isopropylmalate dehydrogenase